MKTPEQTPSESQKFDAVWLEGYGEKVAMWSTVGLGSFEVSNQPWPESVATTFNQLRIEMVSQDTKTTLSTFADCAFDRCHATTIMPSDVAIGKLNRADSVF